MAEPDGDAPSKLSKLLFNVGYHPWMWLYGSYGERWRLRRPIFMIGCPRSGTGLALRMFARHPDVANLSEAGDLWDPRRYNDPEADHLWTANDVTPEDTKRMHSRFEFWRALHGAPRFINKHPRNSVRIEYLRAMFPDAVFIHVIRDGRAVVNSILNRIERETHRKRLPFWNFCKPPEWRELLRDDPTEQAALQWREILRYVFGKRAELASAYHQFRYEDLCVRPREVIGAAWRFAGLPAEAELSLLPEALEDRGFKWRQDLSAKQVELIDGIQRDLLLELGYPI